MKAHVQVWFEFFDFGDQDFIPCEICGGRAVDVHHIHARGMGGSTLVDVIENLMALCRYCHQTYGDISEFIPLLENIHGYHITHKDKFKLLAGI